MRPTAAPWWTRWSRSASAPHCSRSSPVSAAASSPRAPMSAATWFAKTPILANMMTLPLAIGGICIITSIIGTFFVKLGASQSIMGALYKGLIATGVLSLLGVALAISWMVGFGKLAGVDYTGMSLFICGVVGLAVTGLIIWITE